MSNKVRNVSKILFFMIVVAISLLSGMPKSEAASFSITSGISSITVGNSYTISISADGLTGKFNISHSSNVSVNVSSVWVENGKADSTIKVTTKKEGEATVTLTPETIADSEGNDVTLSAKTDRVTVKAKSSSGESSEGSSTSGSESSSGNSSSNETTKTEAPTFTSVNETVYVTEDGINVRSSYSTSSKALGSVNKGDSLTRIGVATSTIDGIKWSKVKYNGQTAYITSTYLSTEKPEESNEKNLKSLTIDGDYELTPKFNKDVTEYSLSVGSDVESIKINAEAVDDNAKVEIIGNDKLLEGENTIEIKVTAEDGTVRTYKINITKGEEIVSTDFGLSELSVSGYTLTPNFSTNVYEYKLDIEDETVTRLDVNANSTVEGATVDIAGNNNLKLGENIITILVKSEDGEEIVTYQIVVNITEKTQENGQIIAGIDNKNLYMYSGIGLGVLIVIIIVAVIIVKRRNSMDDEEEYDYYNGFNPLDNNNISNEDNDQEEISTPELIVNKNIKNTNDEVNNEKVEKEESRKSVIEENFGADISYDNFDDEPRRKRGKHF